MEASGVMLLKMTLLCGSMIVHGRILACTSDHHGNPSRCHTCMSHMFGVIRGNAMGAGIYCVLLVA